MANPIHNIPTALDLRAGEWVEVRSLEEILLTLDAHGRLDALPFMPEMIKYCGQRVRVYKRAHKTCDTIDNSGMRQMTSAVHLEDLRCDGNAHGGCQAECLLFWKESWLKRVHGGDDRQSDSHNSTTAFQSRHHSGHGPICTYGVLCKETKVDANASPVQENIYSCQATEMTKATTPIGKNEIHHYLEDVRSGNVSIKEFISTIIFWLWFTLFRLSMRVLRGVRLHVWCYNAVQRARKGVPYPFSQGLLTGKTPAQSLGLKPGELVEVKPFDEIRRTLNTKNRNRGLSWNQEMVPYTGKRYRIRSRVERVIDEKTGRMIRLPNDCLILEDVYCKAWYSAGKQFCPRTICHYWREVWLRRSSEN